MTEKEIEDKIFNEIMDNLTIEISSERGEFSSKETIITVDLKYKNQNVSSDKIYTRS